MSNYVTLPFPGAWVDQPTWLREDFLTLLQVKRWWEMNEKLPSVDGLPKMDDVA